jgi:HNH endonuclease
MEQPMNDPAHVSVISDPTHGPQTPAAELDPAKLLDVVRDVVDWLMPLLKPYEAAFYMHMFRHSWLTTGQPLVRVNYRWLKVEAIRATQIAGRRYDISVGTDSIRQSLNGLGAIGALLREGAPSLEGAIYRVFLPDEIEACHVRRADKARIAEQRAADFYNVRENRLKVFERDQYQCRYCREQLTAYTVTIDHVIPVSAGGDHSLGNLVTACMPCNARKNKKSIADFLADREVT